MAYIREKTVKNKKTDKIYSYYQMVEGVWHKGKVRQKVLAHLGQHPSLEAAREAAAREFRKYQRASIEGTDKAKLIDKSIRERWGDHLGQYRYEIRLPPIIEVLRKAYPKGWDEHPGRGQKFRRAFGLSDEPGETLKSVGEFVVLLNRYWKAFEEEQRGFRAYHRLRHFDNVREYLEEGSAKSLEDYMRRKRDLKDDLRRARLESSYEDDS